MGLACRDRSSRASRLDRFVPSSALRNGHFAALYRTLMTGSNGSPISGLCQAGDTRPCGLLSAAVAVQSVADLRHASVVLIRWLRRCAPVTHQDQGLAHRAHRSLHLPLAGTPAPENPLFLAAFIPIDRVVRSLNFMAPLRAVQPHVARGAGATSLQTVGMAVARNQNDGSANPEAALPPPSPDRQPLFMRRLAHHRTARHRA
jgi:hypothetical protein